MQHELAMRLLVEQRSEQLIRQAERDNRAAGLRLASAGAFPRLLGRVAARLSALARAEAAFGEPAATGKSLDWPRPLLQDFDCDPGGHPAETAAVRRPLGG